MGTKEKRAYLNAIIWRYKKAGRHAKTRILEEFCAVCRYNRKYAIRLLNAQPKYGKAKRGRKSKYTGKPFLRVLPSIWKAADFMCSDFGYIFI